MVRSLHAIATHAPSAADHVALRALIKYMSTVLSIPYKAIVVGDYNESTVKNYVNDKSTRSHVSTEMYQKFSAQCAKLIADSRQAIKLDDYAIHILAHLFGESWIRSQGLSLPASNAVERSLDGALSSWLRVSSDQTDEIETRYRGLWRVIRASSPPSANEAGGASDVRELSYSLLNIRPRSVRSGTLCDFRWYYLGRDREKDEYRVFEGFVVPNVDRIEFVGRSETGHALLVLMVWRFASNKELTRHALVANGQSLAINTDGIPVSARLRAFFVEKSEQLEGTAFDELKNEELALIGVERRETLDERIPKDQVEKTRRYLAEYRPIVGFFPSRDDTPDG